MKKEYYGYVYKTTIKTKEGFRYYYGQHHYTNYPNIDETYIGSGTILRSWLKKHFGSENYNYIKENTKDIIFCEILCWCRSKDELNLKEFEIIEKYLGKEDCWNLSHGGYFYNDSTASKREILTEQHKLNISKALKGKKKTKIHCQHLSEVSKGNKNALGCKRSEETKELLRKINTGKKWPDEVNKKKGRSQKGRKWYHNDIKNVFRFECPEGFIEGYKVFEKREISEETRKRMSEAAKSYKHKPQSESQKQKMKIKHSGKGNPAYGRKWYTNGEKNVYLKDNEEIPEGFYKGRISNREKKYWWNNGLEERQEKESPGEGWIKGRLRRKSSSK